MHTCIQACIQTGILEYIQTGMHAYLYACIHSKQVQMHTCIYVSNTNIYLQLMRYKLRTRPALNLDPFFSWLRLHLVELPSALCIPAKDHKRWETTKHGTEWKKMGNTYQRCSQNPSLWAFFWPGRSTNSGIAAMHLQACSCMHVHLRVCARVRVHVCVRVHMCVCVRVHVCLQKKGPADGCPA